jgi:hypothetical protein
MRGVDQVGIFGVGSNVPGDDAAEVRESKAFVAYVVECLLYQSSADAVSTIFWFDGGVREYSPFRFCRFVDDPANYLPAD